MNSVRDRVFIITGAGGAIAGAVEEAFAEAGARLLLVDRDPIRIQGRATSFHGPPIEADMLTFENAQAMLEQARRHVRRIDGLIHLVGDVVTGRVDEVAPEAFDQAFDTNVRTLFHAVKVVLPELLERQDGFIAGVASQQAWGGGAAGASLFAAAKSAVATFLRSLDAELEGTDIRVAIAYPMGPVDTHSNRQQLAPDSAAAQTLIDPRRIAEALLSAAQFGPGGRLLELPIYPPRAKAG